MDCFRPTADFVLLPRHTELHAAAHELFCSTTCVLQHYTLQFLAEVRLSGIHTLQFLAELQLSSIHTL